MGSDGSTQFSPIGLKNGTINMDAQTTNFYYLPLCLLSIMAIFGNAMVIASVIVEKRLRSLATNHFVASLALSDLLVGALAMPFGVYIKMNNNAWDLNRTWCQFHLSSTVFATAASILNLVAISIDRYFAIIFPTEYQRHSLRTKSAPYIVMVWVISTAVCAPIFLENIKLDQRICWIEDPQYMIMSALLTFFIPACIITYLYSKIFKRIRKHLNLFWAGARSNNRRGLSSATLPQVIVEEVRSRRNSRIDNNSSPSASSKSPSQKITTDHPGNVPRSRFSSLGACSLDVPLVGFGDQLKDNSCESRRMSIASTFNVDSVIAVPKLTVPKFNFPFSNKFNKSNSNNSNLSINGNNNARDPLLTPQSPQSAPNTSTTTVTLATSNYKLLSAPKSNALKNESLVVTTTFLQPEKHSLKPPPMGPNCNAIINQSQSESHLQTGNPALDVPNRHITFSQNNPNNCNMDLRKSIYISPSRGSTVSGISTPGTLSSVTSQSSEERKSSMFSYGSSLDDDYFDMISAGSSRKSSGIVADRITSGTIQEDGEKSNKKSSSNVLHTSGNKLRRIAQQVTRAIRRKRRESQAIRRETRATRVVAAILAVFILCWLPYFCGIIRRSIVSSLDLKLEYNVYLITSWLGYSHSCFNCVIYTCLNKIFRSTFKRLLCFWTLKKKRC